MKRPSILKGLLFALGLALASLPVFWTASAVQVFTGAARTTLALAHLLYTAHLLRARGGQVGTPTLAAVNLVLTAVVWWAAWPLGATAVVLAGLTCLNRSLLFHRSPSAAVLDAALGLTGVFFAGKLMQPHTDLAAALWVFFLLQSAWVLIPGRGFPAARPSAADPFTAGRRQAEAALEKLAGDGG